MILSLLLWCIQVQYRCCLTIAVTHLKRPVIKGFLSLRLSHSSVHHGDRYVRFPGIGAAHTNSQHLENEQQRKLLALTKLYL